VGRVLTNKQTNNCFFSIGTPGFWGRSQATLHMSTYSTIDIGILGPIPTRGENDAETYWLIGCFSGYSMETFQQVDGVYSDYPPTDACNRLFPGLI
jgi:hypothetical protein